MLPQKVVSGINTHDSETQAWVYDNYSKKVLACIRENGCACESEDLTHDTFRIFFAQPGPFPSVRHIQQFLFTTALNQCREFKQREKRFQKVEDLEPFLRNQQEEETRNAEASERFYDLMRIAGQVLSPQCKYVVILSYRYREENALIAERLNISEKRVANLKTEAHKKLKLVLGSRNNFYIFNFLL